LNLKRDNKKIYIFGKHPFKVALFVFSAAVFLAFLCINLALLIGTSYSSGNFFIESIKIIQFCLLVFLAVIAIIYRNKYCTLLFVTIAFVLQIILICYFLIAKKSLDFMFFSLNKSNLVDVFMPYMGGILLIFLVASFIAYFFLKSAFFFRGRKSLFIFIILTFIFILPSFRDEIYLNETFKFFKSFLNQDEIIDIYQIHYKELVDKSILDKKLLASRMEGVEKKEGAKYLENIIFLQIESLNGRLMSSEVTPNFYKIAENGTNFTNFYANGVQTILGQENLLCSLPSSFYGNLNSIGNDKKVLCLPEFFNKLGYRTSFFKTYDLEFTNTGKFMRNIGFAETHMEDIMQEDDPKYHWGYKEDIFYQRAFSFIDKNYEKKNNFLFLEVGPTNHWPFKTPADYLKEVPHQKPGNQKERLENTMFLQDKYLGIAWNEINKTFPEKNYTVVIVGDHSWPSGEHPGNEFCGSGSFEENFKTGLTIIFGDKDVDKGRIVSSRTSHMDLLPSFMDLFDVKLSENDFRKSFFEEKFLEKKTILIQPFSERYLVFIDERNRKHIYNSKERSWTMFDLNKDSKEEKSAELIKGKDNSFEFMQNFMPLVGDERIIMHALGGVGRFDYTNSKEAFYAGLAKKRTFFEIDVNVSSDNQVVLSHANVVNQTKKEFMDSKIRGGFTPIELESILNEMQKNKSLILITDVKGKNYNKVASVLFKEIAKQDKDVISRIIPEIYDESTFYLTKERFGFNKMIYTLYKDNKSDKEVIEFVKKNRRHIPIVVMSKFRFNKTLNNKLREMGVKTFVHTLNDKKEIFKFRKAGIYGIFTDNY